VKIRAVLDTNVLVSGVFWEGAPFEILVAWRKSIFTLVVSPAILDEYRRVLLEMTKKRPIGALGPILEVIELHSEMVSAACFPHPICSDPDDDKFLEAAVAAEAGVVVSGDAALLRLRNFQRIEIATPLRFLGLLRRRCDALRAARRRPYGRSRYRPVMGYFAGINSTHIAWLSSGTA
jgi:putative PIN family toxin of toxin-antitoxin system